MKTLKVLTTVLLTFGFSGSLLAHEGEANWAHSLFHANENMIFFVAVLATGFMLYKKLPKLIKQATKK